MLCRALHEYLGSSPGEAAIVARTHSERQKRNRSFAAEFLVPAVVLRRRIRRPVVTEDEIQDLAEEFSTSELLIRHQIRNHHLARIVEWTP